MQDETTVNAADIARLADVGRTAVSNWRRRYADFPQPVGGTPVSPVFALAEVEAWLRSQGKLLEIPLAERAWQELRARAGDDLQLAAALADAGSLLAADPASAPPGVRQLAAALGPADAFEVLLLRFHELQGRRSTATPPETAELMAALAGDARTVFDPACGTAELLLAARGGGARRLLGQDAAPDVARLAAIRLRLTSADATVRTGNSLLSDAFPGVLADAVLCDPPFHERAWGHEELTADPRWIYGLPPRLEPELAWVQHALAHLAPAGLAVVLMPAAAAARRPGRRIRAQLLRKGVLRAVVALSATHHLWLLRRPAGDMPGTVLLAAAADQDTVVAAWRSFGRDGAHDDPGVSRAVPIIDLLDEDVDLTPARHLTAPAAGRTAERIGQAQERLEAAVGELRDLLPAVRPALRPTLWPAGDPRELIAVPVAELARMGYLTIHHGPARGDTGPGEAALLTVEDVIADRPASGRGRPDERQGALRAGDIVVAAAAGRLTTRVLDAGGPLLGPGLTLLRVDPGRLDPHFVAGALRNSASARAPVMQAGSTGRADIRRAQIPYPPLAEQRAYGAAFRRMERLERAARAAAALSEDMARLLADAVAEGTLEPPDCQAAPPEAR